MFDIQVREVPVHQVMRESASVAQADLFDHLIGAMARVHAAATPYGGVAGTIAWPYLERHARAPEPIFFVTYHGNPNDGPVLVEVEAPVRAEPADGIVVLPAHREAFVRLRKEQVPDVGQAYQAVEKWVRANGLDIDGPPREVYYTDFPTAAPGDDVFDVAFPVRAG